MKKAMLQTINDHPTSFMGVPLRAGLSRLALSSAVAP